MIDPTPSERQNPFGVLRDVPGVEGSFVVSDLGRLLARDMPPVFGDEVLGEVGPRALRLRDTLGYAGEDMDSAVIRYADYLLLLRPLSDGVLCVLARQEANVPAVKMAMSLCARRLEGQAFVASAGTTEDLTLGGKSRGYGI